jgi:hypothetical protein
MLYRVARDGDPDYLRFRLRHFACEDCAGDYTVSEVYDRNGPRSTKAHPSSTRRGARACTCASRFS